MGHKSVTDGPSPLLELEGQTSKWYFEGLTAGLHVGWFVI